MSYPLIDGVLSKQSISSSSNSMNQNRQILCSIGDLTVGLGVELQMVSIIKKLQIHRLVFTGSCLVCGLL